MTPDGALEIANRPILEYFGKTAEELKEWTTTDAVHPDDLPRVLSAWRHSIESGQLFTDEHRQRRSDGVYRWFHVQGLPVRDEEGRIVRWCVLQTDIDERKRAEQALRESERELRQLVDSVPGMIAVGGSTGELEYANKRFLDFLGMTIDELSASFVGPIHPDERETMQNEWLRSSAVGQAVEVVQRLRRFDGVYRWVHVRVDPLRDDGGRIVRWYGLHTDIDDQRRAEERVRQSERELRQILDLTPQHITEFGPDGRRLYNNRAALDYHGLTLEEWQSAESQTLLHPEDAERVTREQPGNFQSGSAFETEMRLRKRDGQCRWFLVRFRPMLDEQGSVTRWYAAATDIDDRKRAELRLHNENVALREEIDSASMFEEIVGTSASLQTVLSRVSKVAPSDSSVLITGETGTGKELVARAIHRRSRRSSRAFVSVNCGAIPRDLIASELFGHEKGAFTGATQRRLGRFELAEGGTIFLDEIGELPAETQIALLRVLQEHEFERLGGGGSIRTNVRVIAATNRDLEAAVSAGTFRSDLFYRLNVFPIEVPSLRQRREDIPLLVEYFIDRYARKARKSFQTVHKPSLDLLQSVLVARQYS